jgi:hypothetical protein
VLFICLTFQHGPIIPQHITPLQFFCSVLRFVSSSTIPQNGQSGSPEISWQKSLGGGGFDEAHGILQTADKGYIVAGYETISRCGDVSGNHGLGDDWIVKLDSTGTMEWQKCLGGSDDDWGPCHSPHLGRGLRSCWLF